MFLTGFWFGLAIAAVVVAVRCQYRVDEGWVAVLTRFGRARTAGDGALLTFGPGLHAKAPWDRVHLVDMKERGVVLSGEDGASAMANDGTVLRIDSTLRYVPIASGLRHFLFGLRRPIDHVTGLYQCVLRNELANFRTPEAPDDGSYALLRRERRALGQRLEEFSRARIGERYGIRFEAIDLTDLMPADELADALNAVIQARSEADVAYARAESDAERRELAAERGLEIARERAKAAETEIDTLGTHLAALHAAGTLRAYVDRRRAEVTSEAKTYYLRRQP